MQGNMPDTSGPPPEFVQRLTASQSAMYAFIVSLLGGANDADDVLQETNMKLCRRWSQYDREQPFLRWAYAFARNHALKYLEAKSRERGIQHFSGPLLEQIAFAREAFDASIEERRRALDACLQRLRPEQRELIRERFAGQQSLKNLAASSGVSPASLTMRLQRLRHALLKCIEQALAAKEAT